jgi:hypothetical protein
MLTTAGAIALVFPPAFGLVALALLAMLPVERRAAMDRLVGDYSRLLAGTSILAGLSALLVGLLAYATVGTEVAIYAAGGLVMSGYVLGTGLIVWREAAGVNDTSVVASD